LEMITPARTLPSVQLVFLLFFFFFSSFFFLLFGRTNPTLTPQAHFRKQAHPTKVRVKYFMGTLTVRILWACFWCLRATSSHILSRTPQPSCSLTSRARTNGMSASRPPISRLRETISWDSPLPQEMLQVCVLPSAAILQFPIALHLFELDNHDIIRVTTYMISLVSSIPRRVLNRIHFFFLLVFFYSSFPQTTQEQEEHRRIMGNIPQEKAQPVVARNPSARTNTRMLQSFFVQVDLFRFLITVFPSPPCSRFPEQGILLLLLLLL